MVLARRVVPPVIQGTGHLGRRGRWSLSGAQWSSNGAQWSSNGGQMEPGLILNDPGDSWVVDDS